MIANEGEAHGDSPRENEGQGRERPTRECQREVGRFQGGSAGGKPGLLPPLPMFEITRSVTQFERRPQETEVRSVSTLVTGGVNEAVKGGTQRFFHRI